MRPERWKVVEQILEAALEQAPDERLAFIAQACRGDEELRREVETLIKAYDQAGSFIEAPLLASVATAPQSNIHPSQEELSASLIGKRIGAYKIESEIGRGGMGAVYLALRADNVFQRRVAIKIVKRGMDTDFILRRFRRERQILATLDHPHIAALLDGGSTSEGLPYFVMEYVEGKPLNRFCDERKLTIAERLRLVQQVCAAVSYAHQKQIIHRDLKPGNILVTSDGTAKLLDFGIAKLLDPEWGADTIDQTATAVRLMTPEYASPEQVRGLPVTPSSDVYSLGVLMYELLTGRRPYRLSSHAPHEMARVICEETPTRPSSLAQSVGKIHYAEERSATPESLRHELEGNLDSIILKALSKDPQQRYASASELAADIGRHLAGQTALAALAPSLPELGEWLEEFPTARSIAVLPLKVIQTRKLRDDDSSYLGVGIADALTTQLSNIRGLVVRPTSSVLCCVGADADPFAAGKELGVDYLLDGRVQLAGEQMRVTMQLVSLQEQAILWASQYRDNLTDILVVQDSIAAQVAEAIIPHLTGEERARLVRRGTDDPRAYEAYMRGRYHWHSYTMDSLAQALLYFNEASSFDPSFAAPYAGIAEYYNRLATFGILPSDECFAAAKEAALRAVRLDESLAEAWGALAFATLGADWNHNESLRLINRALELNPNSAQVLEWYAHILGTSGRLTESNTAIERALKLDPGSAAVYVLQSLHLYLTRRYEASLKAAEQATRLDPNSFWSLFGKAMSLSHQRRYEEAEAVAASLIEANAENPIAKVPLAYAQARQKKTEAARALLQQMLTAVHDGYLTPYYVALIYEALEERDEALKWVEKGIVDRDWWMLYLLRDPFFIPLRNDARCQALLQRVGLIEPPPDAAVNVATVLDSVVLDQAPVAKPQSRRRFAAGIGLAGLIVALLFWLYQSNQSRNAATTFRTTTATKLTTSGNAVIATISPDGKYLAYVTEDGGLQSLWMRQVSVASSVRLAPPSETEYRGLSFTPDGSYVRYVARNKADNKSALHEVPALGGSARLIKEKVDSPIGLSPDGKQIAFVRHHDEQGEDDLLIASTDGSNERQVQTRKFPEHFSSNSAPAWTPDGNSIAVVVETADAKGFFMKAIQLRVQDGTESLLTTGRWMNIDQIRWMPDGKSFLWSAQDAESPFLQLWSISNGQARKLTNDLSDYKGVSLPSNLQSIVTVQRQVLINIWVAPKGIIERMTQITTGAGRYFDLSWTPEKTVLYASDASGSADIWERHSSSAEQTQLTAGASRNYAPLASPDGKYIVFHSNRSGNWQIWRMNRDGSNQVPLTSGNEESNWPQVTPDGKWVVYEHFGAGTQTTLWKRPMANGDPVRLTSKLSMRPAISPDGKWVACWSKADTPNAPWRIALIPIEGGEASKHFDVRQGDASGGSVLRWMPDGRGITYIDFRNGVASLWLQSTEGGAPKKLLESTNDVIYSFDIARDGSIAFSRGLRAHDVVLLSDTGNGNGAVE
ncbi:MAG: protein kinase [Acidobacteria bacterium]|nr:protein kinase [Acidobacteriota bacterium]